MFEQQSTMHLGGNDEKGQLIVNYSTNSFRATGISTSCIQIRQIRSSCIDVCDSERKRERGDGDKTTRAVVYIVVCC